MKSQTHYQVKTQIAGQIGNKKQQYLPHKWRGNTLVPVIIALAISALATIAFLNQGANLQEDTKVVAAQNEIIALLEDYNVAKQMNGGKIPTVSFISGNNATFSGTQLYTAPSGTQTNGVITFHTDTVTSCASLAGKIPTTGNVQSINCANNTATKPEKVVLTINVK